MGPPTALSGPFLNLPDLIDPSDSGGFAAVPGLPPRRMTFYESAALTN
jgi:hypothetical protein